MTASEPLTPTETYRRRRFRRGVGAILLVAYVIGVYLFWRFVPSVPQTYTGIEDHFKYGSIGSDNLERGLPYWVWKVLPEMFREHLPDPGRPDYSSFGFILESGRDRPIGFSKRRVRGIELVGLNCAVCHTSTLRDTADSPSRVIVAMPANTVDLQAFFRFLFRCAEDERFTVETVMEQIQEHTRLGPIDRWLYRRAIAAFRDVAREQKQAFSYWNHQPHAGPGRVDTFGPYKALFFDLEHGQAVGSADFPSIWNQKPREGMSLHWDGNNNSVFERNISASIGAGVTPQSLDRPRLKRIEDWIWELPPPPYPADRLKAEFAKMPAGTLELGRRVYHNHCASCHAFEKDYPGSTVGQVVPIDQIATDPNRLNSFTPQLANHMNTLGTGYPWEFERFKKTNGYANMPLDGVWLRAPYLHNGSVPTLWHLLLPAEDRPTLFYRGNDRYEWERGGFVWDQPKENDRRFFEYRTEERGNGNAGHEYGTDLSDKQKKALLMYMKTF